MKLIEFAGQLEQVLAPLVKKQFIKELNKDEFRDLCIRECTYFLYIHHITDATVIWINRPIGTHPEVKPYYSLVSIFADIYAFLNYFIILHQY